MVTMGILKCNDARRILMTHWVVKHMTEYVDLLWQLKSLAPWLAGDPETARYYKIIKIRNKLENNTIPTILGDPWKIRKQLEKTQSVFWNCDICAWKQVNPTASCLEPEDVLTLLTAADLGLPNIARPSSLAWKQSFPANGPLGMDPKIKSRCSSSWCWAEWMHWA